VQITVSSVGAEKDLEERLFIRGSFQSKSVKKVEG